MIVKTVTLRFAEADDISALAVSKQVTVPGVTAPGTVMMVALVEQPDPPAPVLLKHDHPVSATITVRTGEPAPVPPAP